MKVALAHDFLIRWGGAEKVLFDLHKIFPDAPIYTLFYDKKFVQNYFPGIEIRSSYLQKRYQRIRRILGIIRIRGKEFQRMFLPFIPPAVESLDFSEYDLVLSSSSAFMKGIIVPSKTKHICYLHTPARWAWQDYLTAITPINAEQNAEITLNKSALISVAISVKSAIKTFYRVIGALSLIGFLKHLYVHFYRLWDFEAAQRPDILIANSDYTAQKIEKYYRRKAKVVYPGAEFPSKSQILSFQKQNGRQTGLNGKFQMQDNEYFIMVSRLSFYKHVDWAIEAFKDLPYNLVIVGEGPEERKLKRKANQAKTKERIKFVGFVKNRDKLLKLIKDSLGLIHLAEEDFGLVMLEALKLGRPVIALDRGGSRELIKPGINGELIHLNEGGARELEKVIIKIGRQNHSYAPDKIKESVKNFSEKAFEEKMKSIIDY